MTYEQHLDEGLFTPDNKLNSSYIERGIYGILGVDKTDHDYKVKTDGTVVIYSIIPDQYEDLENPIKQLEARGLTAHYDWESEKLTITQ